MLDLLLAMGFKLIHHNSYPRRLGFFVLFDKNSRRLIACYLNMACQQFEIKRRKQSVIVWTNTKFFSSATKKRALFEANSKCFCKNVNRMFDSDTFRSINHYPSKWACSDDPITPQSNPPNPKLLKQKAESKATFLPILDAIFWLKKSTPQSPMFRKHRIELSVTPKNNQLRSKLQTALPKTEHHPCRTFDSFVPLPLLGEM